MSISRPEIDRAEHQESEVPGSLVSRASVRPRHSTVSAPISARPRSSEIEAAPEQATLLGISMTRTELERTRLLFVLLFVAALIFVVGRTARDALFLTKFPVTWIAPMWMAYGAV